MYRVTTIQAYDVMDQVFINARVKTYDDQAGGELKHEVTYATTILGSGEPEPSEWLRDLLVGLIEAL